MRINQNIAALNAWRNLGASNAGLGKSLEKLSSGYRINRGSDDPSGLLISEKLRAQIGGLTQAIANANDAISMVQTAEGALTEMNTMLNSIRTLAVHAANTGSNDSASIAADQTAVDKAVESIQRIATTTQFAGKNLLDGSSTGATMVLEDSATGVTLTTVGTIADGASGAVDLAIGTAATEAHQTQGAFVTSTVGSITIVANIDGVKQASSTYTITASVSAAIGLSNTINEINADFETTGIWASGSASELFLEYRDQYGTAATLEITADAVYGGTTATVAGTDIAGTIDGDTLQGSGLVLYGNTANDWAGTTFTIAAAENSVQTFTDGVTVDSNGSELKFSLTESASSTDIISYGINNMQATEIGVVATVGNTNTGLNAIKEFGDSDLSTAAEEAVQIIDQAISDVSTERANLGAFQKFTLESTINNLGVTKENLSSSESRIRDVDMAAEMMTFTKNQILVQAGTAMLAQANQLPSSVLQLLG